MSRAGSPGVRGGELHRLSGGQSGEPRPVEAEPHMCVTAPVRDARQGTRTEMLRPLKCFRSEGGEKLPGRPLCPSIIPWPSLTGA